jgi:hypothetical protein
MRTDGAEYFPFADGGAERLRRACRSATQGWEAGAPARLERAKRHLPHRLLPLIFEMLTDGFPFADRDAARLRRTCRSATEAWEDSKPVREERLGRYLEYESEQTRYPGCCCSEDAEDSDGDTTCESCWRRFDAPLRKRLRIGQ